MGFAGEKQTIRQAMIQKDVALMLDSVSDDMVDALVLAGTPDDVRRQLSRFENLFDSLILLSPSFATGPQEVREDLVQ